MEFKKFIVLLSNIVNRSNHTECVPLRNQKCMIQPTLIILHNNEYSQEFHYYPFAVKLGRCVGSCNTLNDLSNKVCVPKKTEDLNLSVFNGGMMINVDVSTKNVMYVKKIIFRILLHVVVKIEIFSKYYG